MEARVLKVELERKQVTIRKLDYKKFQRYLKEGYFVIERKDGLYVLEKKSRVLVTFECEEIITTINFKEGIRRYYGMGRTEELIDRFKRDLKDKRVSIQKDSNGYFSIVRK